MTRVTVRKLAQGAVFTSVLVCYALLAVHERRYVAQDASQAVDDAWPDADGVVAAERAPRSINANSRLILSLGDADRSGNERDLLNDVFISVKTTKKYHESRLDVIVRTWFVLAREQVSANTHTHTHTT